MPAVFSVVGQVVEDVASLALDAGAVVRKRGVDAGLRGHAALEVAGQLARREDQVAGNQRLRCSWPGAGAQRRGAPRAPGRPRQRGR